MIIKNLPRLMDFLGAILFLMLLIYFTQKKNKSNYELLLTFLVGIGLFCDVAFITMYVNGV